MGVYKRYRQGMCAVCAMLIVSTSIYAGAVDPLDLATMPLFAGASVPPNILVAIDDSGSMDFEVLFPTPDGLLYWRNGGNLIDRAWDGDSYAQSGTLDYGYLFPNGYKGDGRIYLYSHEALPPVPDVGFARSPQYNNAYFNPNTAYQPWIGRDAAGTPLYPPSRPTAAYYDPTIRSHTLDLTKIVQSSASGHKFTLLQGMTIPAGTAYYHSGSFHAEDHDVNCGGNCGDMGIEYYPATFYLKAQPAGPDIALPADFGWRTGAPIIQGRGPRGEQLAGYEIRSENFVSDVAYKRAIQNFANWFTYYRKRHLATRGGITAAFDQIDRARVGHCTINDRDTFDMENLSAPAERLVFYKAIYDVGFGSTSGTPNRKGLQFLGDRLRNDKDIIQSPCQQNFAILFTDGYNTEGVSRSVGNVDAASDSGLLYGKPFADNASDTIADVAMEYYAQLGPIANDAIERNKVPVSTRCKVQPPAKPEPGLDCQNDLHMVTFGVTLGQQGYIFDNPAYEALNNDPYHNWPAGLEWANPNNGDFTPDQIDDLWHATINTHGKLLNAKTPQAIADAFGSALGSIISASGGASGLAADSGAYQADTQVYQASFVGDTWSGDLTANYLDSDLTTVQQVWSAADTLRGRDANDRTILSAVRQDEGEKNNRAVPAAFRYADLAATGFSGLSEAQVNYIRGDRSNEQSRGGTLRDRGENILGDIVHSTPVYVGEPLRLRYPAKWIDNRHQFAAVPENSGAPYVDAATSDGFYSRHAGRDPLVYVGANDGMLHGFDADSGEERLGYVPADVLPALDALTQPGYVHRYYVDGSPVEGDAFFGGTWHSVLVGGQRAGGRSVYALDITDPDSFSEDDPSQTVLWEFSDNGLGATYGAPSIVRLHNGRWGVIVGNGYNSKDLDASLYILDISDGSVIAHLAAGSKPTDGQSANGLSSPFPVDLDGDLITDYIYAGDLQGHVWKFDVTGANPAQWTSKLLFTATNDWNQVQPITTQVQVGAHPYGLRYGVMVYVATGKYLERGDAARNTALRNSVYGIWDSDVFTFNEADNGDPLFSFSNTADINRWNLVGQTAEDITVNGSPYRLVSDNPVDYQTDASGPHVMGWYLDLPPGEGEMVVSDPRIQGNALLFSTSAPDQKECTPGGGSGYVMAIRLDNGGRTDFPLFDLNGDKLFNDRDRVSVNQSSAAENTRVGVSGVGIDQGLPGQPHTMRDRNNALHRLAVPTSNGAIVQLSIKDGDEVDRRRSWHEIRR